MDRFLKDIVSYGLSIFLLSLICSTFLYHSFGKDYYYDYETSTLISKLNYFFKSDHNTAFIGTSKTLRQINTREFSKHFEGEISAFNMGIIGLFPFRMIDYAKRISKKKGLKYIFFEIAPLDRIGENYDYNPNIHALSPSRYFSLLCYLNKNQIKLKTKVGYLVYYTIAFAYKYLGLGGAKQLLLYFNANQPVPVPTYIDEYSKNGFLPFDPLIKKGQVSKNMLRANAQLMENPEQIQTIISSYKNMQKSLLKSTDCYLISLEELAKNISEKGINLIFILPPRQMDYGLSVVLNQKNYLTEKGYNVLDFSNPDDFPQLYLVENSFDVSHLNEKGASVYTKEIISGFKALLND